MNPQNIQKNQIRIETLTSDLISINQSLSKIKRIAGNNIHLNFIHDPITKVIEDIIPSAIYCLTDEEVLNADRIPDHGMILNTLNHVQSMIKYLVQIRNDLEFLCLSGDDQDVNEYLISLMYNTMSHLRRINQQTRRLHSEY